MANSTTTLSSAVEESTYIINVSFYDSEGAALVPQTITWSLYNKDNRIINNRSNVSIAVPAATNYIVLGANDLMIGTKGDKLRILKVSATYNSTDYGNNLPLKSACKFTIDNIV